MTFHKRFHAELPFPESSAWGRCITAWIQEAYRRSGSEDTRRLYHRTVYTFLSRVGKSPENVTREDVLSYIHSPSTSTRNPGGEPSTRSINNRLAILSAFYSFSAGFTVEVEGRPEPLLKVIPPTMGIRAGKAPITCRGLSLDEVETLFASIPTDTVRGLRARAIYSVFFWSCRRRMEICRLRWKDLEQATIISKDGRRRTATIYRWKNKGSPGLDSAELPEPAAIALHRYLEASGRMSTITGDDPLFTRLHERRDIDQHQGLNDQSVAYELQYWCKKAGLEHVSLHDFRRAGAKARFESGSDLREVQSMLRHKSIQTTDLYIRSMVSVEDTGAKRLAAHYSRFS